MEDENFNEIDEDLYNELQEEYDRANYEALKKQNAKLLQQIRGGSPSILEQYRRNNKSITERNKKLREENEALKKENKKYEKMQLRDMQHTKIPKISDDKKALWQRMTKDFNEQYSIQSINGCPNVDNIVFDHFYELVQKYPNRTFIKSTITNMLNEQIKLKQNEIDNERANIDLLLSVEKKKEEYGNDWEKYVDNKVIDLYNITTVDSLEKNIEKLQDDIANIKEWKKIPRTRIPPSRNVEKVKNTLYYQTINEFKRLYFLLSNLKNIWTYQGNIVVSSFTPNDMLSALCKELEKQIGLCEEPTTNEYYFNNGEGRFVPFKHDRDIVKQIQNNTTFIKETANSTQYKDGILVSATDIFEKIPNWIQGKQYKNQNLVGFNNCFYNIEEQKIEKLNYNVPLLPLRNTKTELYLDEKIDGGAMEHIFNECFSKQDKEALLSYLGCCLYDKGYTQRQESIFLLSKGETGKTTFIKAICEIFYQWESQIVTKLSDEKFGLSMFGENDCIIIDEIQGAKNDFAEILKTISTGSNLAVEKKNKNTINIPSETVPRCWFIGNQFPRNMYDKFAGEGVFRRVLVIIPKKSIKDLGYRWQDLITDECKQWLVQQATKTYIELELDKKSIPIPSISAEEKQNRIEKCTYPERYFVKEHFAPIYDDKGKIDQEESVTYTEMHTFIHNYLLDKMLEPTIKMGNSQTFIKEVKEALNLPSEYHTKTRNGEVIFVGIKPKSIEAIQKLGGQ